MTPDFRCQADVRSLSPVTTPYPVHSIGQYVVTPYVLRISMADELKASSEACQSNDKALMLSIRYPHQKRAS